ncbi:amino acid adenylation domain-containing protein, partial [Duganella violaceipulchra]
ELYIGGAGVARGYLNLPQMTEQRFLPDPFAGVAGARMYKTGDLGRHLADGNIEYLGRNDFQVKIRGFRIELGEIETKLSACAGVREAVVLAREDQPGDKRLVAYLLARDGAQLDVAALRAELARTLSEVMLPGAYVVLDAFPLTPNGKLDRKALPAPDGDAYAARGYEAPQGQVEETLAAIWAELLQLERVGRHDNFFELGGHSLLATRLVARLGALFGRQVPLRLIFDAPTLAAQAEAAGGLASALPAIAPVPEQDHYPLSHAQRRLWLMSQIVNAEAAYNVGMAVRLRGALDREKMAQALSDMIARHAPLRSTFITVDGVPMQWPGEALPVELPLTHSDIGSGDPLGDAREALRHFTNQAFNLETGPLLRARLLRLGDDDHVLALVVHHIVADGWSLEVIVGELSASYDALCQHGQARELAPPLSVQYADYALWEKQMLDSGALTAQRDYWLERLGSHLAILQLPTDRARPLVHSFAGARHVTPIDARLGAAAQALAARHGLTPYMLLLAVYQVLLYRLSGQTDILVGTPLAGRHHPQVGEMIGLFVNTLVMRVDLSDDPSFLALMARVRGDTLDAYTNQDYPFDLLVEELSARRDLSRQSIFDTTFTLHNVAAASPARRDIAGLVVEPFELDDSAAKFDLSATVTLDGDAMSLALQYSSELFDPATIARFGSYYVKLLEEVVAAPQTPVSRLRLLGDAERRQLLALSAGADVDTAGAVVDDLAARFARQAAASAAASAVRYEGQSLSYAELDARANRLANYLAGKGVGAESPVVLCLERSLDMIVAILAVLKAGGCYVPMEPGAPDERLAYVLADCGARHAIGHGAHSARLAALLDGAVCLDAEAAAIEACAATAPSPGVDPQRSAYVIYTSGSTGQPKGVQLTHANVLRLFSACARHFDFDHDQVWTMFHSYAFDFSVWEIFGALLHGGRLVVVPQAVTRSPQAFTQLLAAEQVTMLSQTPSAFLRLLEGVAAGLDGAWAATLRYVVFGGEALEYGSLRPWFRNGLNPGTALINMYGITETTVHVTWKEVSAAEVEAGGASDVGRPLADLYCYILDAHREPVPAGVTGELYVGGAGLARGYLNRPELNAERFLANPFVGQPSARLYRSGDLARWSATGGIDYLGRIDHQVKIHGYRIELGEIEAALGRHAGVSACVVLAVKDVRQLQDKLVAYYSAADSLTASALRAFLGQTLPEYMLPSAFVHIAEMPLTINGKIDRSKLKSDLTLRPALDVVYRAPQTSMQIRLANIWGEVLGVSQVGLHDNFFDLGGDSFSAYRLMARILDDLGRDLPLEAIFKMQTIAELELALLDEEGSVAVNSLVMLTPGAPGVRPFFCIHPAGGDVLGFQPLARTLGPRRPFYGLQSPGRFLGESSFYSLEEMATGYLHDILSVQPQGPYLLGGHSMGGKVAYEICRQMEALGHEVAVLAIFDSNIIERASPMVDSLMLLSDIFQLNITREGLLAHQERHMIDHVLKVAKKKFARMLEIAYELDVLPRGFRTKDAEAFLSRIATNIHLSSAYVAQPINTPISLFLASEMTENGDFIDQESWRKVALSGLTVIECPGNHVSLVNYPHVATLAPVLAGIIEQAELRIDAAQAGEGEAVNAE